MANLNIPANPSVGTTYEENGVIYTWTGTHWTASVIETYASGPLAGFRNQIINGGMDVWQRATDYDNTYTGSWNYKTVDRWRCIGSETDTGRTLRVTSNSTSFTGMPEGFDYAFAYWDKADPSTRASFCQAIELAESGGKCRGAAPFTPGGQWTLSCYCSADITPVQARLDFSDSSGSSPNSANYGPAANWVEIEAPTSTRWGRYAVTFTGTSNTFVDSTRCMRVVLGAIGRESTPSQFTSDSSRVAITGVQLEPGPIATPFEHRPIGTELALCQRYFYTISDKKRASAFVNKTGQDTKGFAYVEFPVTMRDVPAVDNITIIGGTLTSTKPAIEYCGFVVTGTENVGNSANLDAGATFEAEL